MRISDWSSDVCSSDLSWWQEYLRQCWFIAKVTSIPSVLISIPFGAVIALHVGDFSRQLGAESPTGAAMVLALVREAAPVATALPIAAAGGSRMPAHIVAAKTSSTLDAMGVFVVNPHSTPRERARIKEK